MAIKTRIQLKNDTEANWGKATGFVPLKGELIIYSTDEAHPFFRLKVGDGETDVNHLPFVTDGNILDSSIVLSFVNRNAFPAIGSKYNLYTTTDKDLYYWNDSEGYVLLNGITYSIERMVINNILSWDAGEMTNLYVDNNILYVKNGTLPTLDFTSAEVMTNIDIDR